MATDPRKTSIGPIDENPSLSAVASGIGSLRDLLNYIDLVKLAGGPTTPRLPPKVSAPELGVGDLLLGKAPEEIKEWAQGNSPFYDQYYGFNPSIRPERREGVVSVATLPAAEAAGIASLVGKGARKGVRKLAGKALEDTATDESRRQFLKKSGGAAAGAAVAGVAGRDLLEAAGRGTDAAAAKTAGKTAAKTVSGKDFIKAMIDIQHRARMASYDAINKMSDREFEDLADKIFDSKYGRHLDPSEDVTPLEFITLDDMPDAGKYIVNTSRSSPGHLYNVSEHLEDAFEKQMHDELLKNPAYKPYAEYIKPHGHHQFKEDMLKKAKGGTIENTTHDRKMI